MYVTIMSVDVVYDGDLHRLGKLYIPQISLLSSHPLFCNGSYIAKAIMSMRIRLDGAHLWL